MPRQNGRGTFLMRSAQVRAKRPQAVVLLSGGLDSAACLYWAAHKGYRCTALCLSYGQRHAREILCARRIAKAAGAGIISVKLPLPWLSVSSLVDGGKALPDIKISRIGQGAIPSTYVPGRNAIFLALAGSLADAIGAQAVVIGANAIDFSGYPDCRPAFYRAFSSALKRGTRRGAQGKPIEILTPLIDLDKSGIIRLALKLKAPIHLTWSCYKGLKTPCGLCDSCKLRARGFAEIGIGDPALS
ncbi:MAG: 7-cyano-7-deazaguanine synthase QueC [Elusimicrobiota bacterium]